MKFKFFVRVPYNRYVLSAGLTSACCSVLLVGSVCTMLKTNGWEDGLEFLLLAPPVFFTLFIAGCYSVYRAKSSLLALLFFLPIVVLVLIGMMAYIS